MQYKNIKQAKFIDRPNRFIAHVEIDGEPETVHVKNTGRCRELLVPGAEVYLTEPGSPGRKTRYDLIAVRKDNGILFNIDSQAPNKVVREWLDGQGFDLVQAEHTYGSSRIDFYMERGGERYLMEVKGCTLEVDGVGYFPDAPTERGVKHLRELMRAASEGYHAVAAFVIQMDGVSEVRPNVQTHPEFGVALKEAVEAGVRVLSMPCHVEPGELNILPEFQGFTLERMESILDSAIQKMDALEKKIAEYEVFQAEIQKLEAYYTSPQWKADFAADEAGQYPDKLKRGVLSEDRIWNMLDRNRELLHRLGISEVS